MTGACRRWSGVVSRLLLAALGTSSMTLALPLAVESVTGAAEFDPGTCDSTFPDVPASSPLCPWIEQLALDGISDGCGGANFCPDLPVTRGQMALFLERAMRGTDTWEVNADVLDGLDSTEFVTEASLSWQSFHRRYYLSTATATGLHATEACLAGFHMASLFEILDPTVLRYAHGPSALSSPDAGQGPPAAFSGWIRTGWFQASTDPAPSGQPNCNAWASETASHWGTLVSLTDVFDRYTGDDGGPDDNVLRLGPWIGSVSTCEIARRVWCVED